MIRIEFVFIKYELIHPNDPLGEDGAMAMALEDPTKNQRSREESIPGQQDETFVSFFNLLSHCVTRNRKTSEIDWRERFVRREL